MAVELLERQTPDVLWLRELERTISETPELRAAYSALHGGVRLDSGANSRKSILVTSTEPREGKTSVASYLAVAASLAGESALLIDGDMRRSRLGSAMGFADGIGLGEMLEGQVVLADAIHAVDLGGGPQRRGNLSFMPAGRKSPSFLPAVNWLKARAVLRSMSQHFDVVLLDSPPVLAAHDALMFARMVDGVLLVIGAGSANRAEVRRVKEQLELSGTPVIGAVLNKFDPKLHGRAHQPYGAYYFNSDP
jgi:capsular exopolysaccharide synthesis family protein